MKKILSLVLPLVLCTLLCACGSKKELANYQSILEERELYIQELEEELVHARDNANENEEIINRQSERISELEEQLNEHEQTMSEYGWMIRYAQNGDYDSIASRLNQLEEEARRAEMEAKGIIEVVITIDNWDQYFEYVPHGYVYIKNAFNEPTHLNMVGGLKLKDEYTMVEDGDTQVNFEMETYPETRTCTVDFTAGTFEYGEVVKTGTRTETTTARFSDSHYGRVLGFGSIDQVNNSKGNLLTRDVTVEAISRMIRAEGTLYLYKNS